MREFWRDEDSEYPIGAAPPYYSDKARELFDAILEDEKKHAFDAFYKIRSGVARVCEKCFQFKCKCRCSRCGGTGFFPYNLLKALFNEDELVLRKCSCKEEWR